MTCRLKNGICESRIVVASTFIRKFFGLKKVAPNNLLLIKNCNDIHTMFFDKPIDVCFIDKYGTVVHSQRALKP